MGCCLTKKSRNKNNRGLNETLLSAEGGRSEEKLQDRVKGHRNGYTPVQVPPNGNDIDSFEGVSMNAQTRTGGSTVKIDGLDNVAKTNMEKTRKVVGTSLMTLPSIKSLKKCGWLDKRGHLVRNWKKRFIVLHDGEIIYYDKANKNETNGAGKPKGRLHLLGAICELKQNDATKLPSIEIIGRQGEKDLLLQYPSLAEAQAWFDAISWTIFRWNMNSLETGDELEEVKQWYQQQKKKFETDFEDVEKGYTFRKHGYDSITGDLIATNCILRGYRDEMCLKWWNILEEDGKKKKSQPFTIYLMDIVDLIVGSYENDDTDMRMMSIVSTTHSLDLEIIDQGACDVFTHALSESLHFLSIPVPSGLVDLQKSGNPGVGVTSILQANAKAASTHKHGKL